jgi:RHS repeat-associated protein
MVVTSHEYLPFGETWITEGDKKNASKYNSQELDKETNYYFYNARHYDPEIGRFITPDTVIDGELSTQGWNRFAYVHNNPIRYKDPTGHDSVLVVSNDKVSNNGKSYYTYRGYVYQDTKVAGKTIFSADTKNKIDEFLGTRLFNKGELEITRNTAGGDHYDTNGSMPPIGKNGTANKYEVRKGTPASGIEKYRIGESDKFPSDRSSLAANATNTLIKNPTRPGNRGYFNFDPYNKPSELLGCLGISDAMVTHTIKERLEKVTPLPRKKHFKG